MANRLGRRLSPWFLLLVCSSGCLPRERFNKNCGWTGDSAFQLDLQNARDQQHFIRDAQLAEELAIRYGDFKHKEYTGYEGHGGLLERGKFPKGCLAKLESIIERTHGVTAQQIADARKHRDGRLDLAVLLSFALLYLLSAMWVSRVVARRFTPVEPRVRAVATLLTSVVASLAGVQLLGLWATTAEMLRVGNDHLGPRRGLSIPWVHHFGELFVGGILVFLLAALLRYRVLPDDTESSSMEFHTRHDIRSVERARQSRGTEHQ